MTLHAIVLAGNSGEGTTDLDIPKPLLPIGKKKLIWFPVKWLEKQGFEEVTIITTDEMKFDINRAVQDVKIVKKFVVIATDLDDSIGEQKGTLDSLRLFKMQQNNNVEKDILLVNCDMITSHGLYNLYDCFLLHDSTITCLLSSNQQAVKENLPGGKAFHKKPDQKRNVEVIGLSEVHGTRKNMKRLLLKKDMKNFEDFQLNLKNRSSKFNHYEARADLEDVHLYILKKELLDYFETLDSSYQSLRKELIPKVLDKQYKINEFISNNSKDIDEQGLFYQQENALINWVKANASERDEYNVAQISEACRDDVLKLHAYVADDEGGEDCDEEQTICVNTLASFVQANRLMFRQDSFLVKNFGLNEKSEGDKCHSSVKVGEKSMVSAECLVSEGTLVGNKSKVKRSVIGKCCKIGNNVTISNSILLDDVTVEDGSSIIGSVICNKANIKEKCNLRDVIVKSKKTVAAKTEVREDVLENKVYSDDDDLY